MCGFCLFSFEAALIYSVVVVSGIQQSDSIIYIFRLFFIIGYYKTLNIVPWTIQQDLIYVFYI